MSFQTPTVADLAVLLASYCSACVSAAHETPCGDPLSLRDKAKAVAVAARARSFGTDELFIAFERAWDKNESWRSLPHRVQSAAYDAALTLLTNLFLET